MRRSPNRMERDMTRQVHTLRSAAAQGALVLAVVGGLCAMPSEASAKMPSCSYYAANKTVFVHFPTGWTSLLVWGTQIAYLDAPHGAVQVCGAATVANTEHVVV